MRIDPPAPVTLEFLTGVGPRPSTDLRRAFQQPAVEIRSGPPDHTLSLDWKIAPAYADIDPGSTQIRIALSQQATGRLDDLFNTFLITVLIVTLRRLGWHHLHAASARDTIGRGWLVAGNARAGKSTTAALMATQGWMVGSDDTTFIAAHGTEVAAWNTRQPLALRRGGRSLLGEHPTHHESRRGKYLCWPEQLGGHWTDRIRPDIILFSTPGEHTTTCTPISPVEALAQLVRWSAWVVLEPDLAQTHLDLLARLARQARSFRAELGSDLFRDPTRLSRLV